MKKAEEMLVRAKIVNAVCFRSHFRNFINRWVIFAASMTSGLDLRQTMSLLRRVPTVQDFYVLCTIKFLCRECHWEKFKSRKNSLFS